jgi:hypothetical protein
MAKTTYSVVHVLFCPHVSSDAKQNIKIITGASAAVQLSPVRPLSA